MAERYLTAGEVAIINSIYGESVDPSPVKIVDHAYLHAATTVVTQFGNIYYPKSDSRYAPDISSGDFGQRATLVHEFGHVWQYQNGVRVFEERGLNGDYNFKDKFDAGVPFEKWGIEEQAAFFEDVYLSSIGLVGKTRSGLSLYQLASIDASKFLNPALLGGSALAPDTSLIPPPRPAGIDQCFLAGTAISMWDGTKKPIEQVQPGDIVTSYNKDGTLKPGRVKRTMTNRAKQILDVHGLMVTPGHATLCGDGLFAGRHVPIIDILRSDGALVLENGSMIRAATGCPLGSPGDRMVTAIVGETQPNGHVKITQLDQIRLGTRFIMASGADVSVLDLIAKGGGMVNADGMITTQPGGPEMPFRWTLTPTLPKPEDYVLQRSATHLHDIYQANEWEAVRPSMPIPSTGEAGPAQSNHPAMMRAAPVNVPLSMQGHQSAPKLSRKYRRAAEAKTRRVLH